MTPLKFGIMSVLTVVVGLGTMPLWGGALHSFVTWSLIEKPAECFSLDTIAGITTCGEWKHCDLDDSKNVAHGYSCR